MYCTIFYLVILSVDKINQNRYNKSMQFVCEDTGEKGINYSEYLVTDHWKLLRMKVFADRKGVCECCGIHMVRGFQVHHKSYENVGHENLNELMLCCSSCHKKQHPEKENKLESKENAPTTKSAIIENICKSCNTLTIEQLKRVLDSVKHLSGDNKKKKRASAKTATWKRKKQPKRIASQNRND